MFGCQSQGRQTTNPSGVDTVGTCYPQVAWERNRVETERSCSATGRIAHRHLSAVRLFPLCRTMFVS